ncbi:MAG: hypothetical protein JOZ32_21090 [Bryobacterales bacterium]|nr:hypothetical protein [Bryobacterales bacterium]
MIYRIVLLFGMTLALTAQQAPPQHTVPPERTFPAEAQDEIRLPNGRLQREEILKTDYRKTLEDARALSKLADELKADLEKNDYNVLSVATLKKTDDIDHLAKRIHDRLKHY